MACLAAGLMAPHGCSLRKLWVVNHEIGTGGVRAAAAALFCNESLTELNLSQNTIKPGDQRVILTVKRPQFSLSLALPTFTFFSPVCGTPYAARPQAAMANTSLKSLTCKSSGLPEAMERELEAAARSARVWTQPCRVFRKPGLFTRRLGEPTRIGWVGKV